VAIWPSPSFFNGAPASIGIHLEDEDSRCLPGSQPPVAAGEFGCLLLEARKVEFSWFIGLAQHRLRVKAFYLRLSFICG